eukprot:693258-Pleurochrysis_carterae.AAC.1
MDKGLCERRVDARDALEEGRELAPVREEGLLRLVWLVEVVVGRVDRLARHDEEQVLQLVRVGAHVLRRRQQLAQAADVRVQEAHGALRHLAWAKRRAG